MRMDAKYAHDKKYRQNMKKKEQKNLTLESVTAAAIKKSCNSNKDKEGK